MRKQLPHSPPHPLGETMSVQSAAAVRTEAIAKPTDPGVAPPGDDRVSDIRLVEVPPHWPPTQAPQAQGPPTDWPQAHQPQVSGALQAGSVLKQGGPDPAHACLADLGDGGQEWPRRFAVLLIETLAGVRPVRQLVPCLSERGNVHLRRLLPLFADGHRPHVTRVLITRPAEDVIEMTLIVTVGPRTRALAVRLERNYSARRPARGEKPAPHAAKPRSPAPASWRCTDIEAA
jgi:hypothetical protein